MLQTVRSPNVCASHKFEIRRHVQPSYNTRSAVLIGHMRSTPFCHRHFAISPSLYIPCEGIIHIRDILIRGVCNLASLFLLVYHVHALLRAGSSEQLNGAACTRFLRSIPNRSTFKIYECNQETMLPSIAFSR